MPKKAKKVTKASAAKYLAPAIGQPINIDIPVEGKKEGTIRHLDVEVLKVTGPYKFGKGLRFTLVFQLGDEKGTISLPAAGLAK